MIDEDRILRLLRSIADDTAVLRQEAQASAERRRDPIWLRGIKYTFVTATEACVDVAQHICATEGWGPPAAQLAAWWAAARWQASSRATSTTMITMLPGRVSAGVASAAATAAKIR